MQTEKYFYDHYNEFEYNYDYVILLKYKNIYINMYMCESIFIVWSEYFYNL